MAYTQTNFNFFGTGPIRNAETGLLRFFSLPPRRMLLQNLLPVSVFPAGKTETPDSGKNCQEAFSLFRKEENSLPFNCRDHIFSPITYITNKPTQPKINYIICNLSGTRALTENIRKRHEDRVQYRFLKKRKSDVRLFVNQAGKPGGRFLLPGGCRKERASRCIFLFSDRNENFLKSRNRRKSNRELLSRTGKGDDRIY